jgi:hypothetical protein
MSDLGFLLDGCSETERTARLRELRVLVAVFCGWDHPAKTALDEVLVFGEPHQTAFEAIDRLPARLRRRLLASYGALTR